MIYPHHLEFIEEAKKAFESNPRFETYRNTAGNLLALRYGMDRNCIAIHEIGEEIAFFAEVMEKAPELVVRHPMGHEVVDSDPSDIRKEILANPNNWTAAFQLGGQWFKVGFNLEHLSPVSIEIDQNVDVTDYPTWGLDKTSQTELEKCISLDDVPKEAWL